MKGSLLPDMADQTEGKVESWAVHGKIRDLTSSEDDCREIWQMWQTIFPKWPIDRQRMDNLLCLLPGQHSIHQKGFCLAFLEDGARGKIAAVGVLPGFRGKGLGTALLNNAQDRLRRTVRGNEDGELKSLDIGSSTPRFWPQLPVDFPPEVKNFIVHRGTSHDPTICSNVFILFRFSQVLRTSSPGPVQRHPRRHRTT